MSWIIIYTIALNSFFNDELILCKECSKWVDDVETSIEQQPQHKFLKT